MPASSFKFFAKKKKCTHGNKRNSRFDLEGRGKKKEEVRIVLGR
jgi:hypothetical protein